MDLRGSVITTVGDEMNAWSNAGFFAFTMAYGKLLGRQGFSRHGTVNDDLRVGMARRGLSSGQPIAQCDPRIQV